MLAKNGVKCLTHTHTSKRCLEIFVLTLFISTHVFALGGIGGGRSTKARNNNGVQAVNAYICANLDCESSNVKIVEKCANKAHMEHGICQCDDGCIGDGSICVDKTCPAGQKPNSDNSACINCEAGQTCLTCTDSTLPNGDGNGHCVCSGTSCEKNKYCASNGECQACATPAESCSIPEDEIDATTQCVSTKKIVCSGETPYCSDLGTCIQCRNNLDCETNCAEYCNEGICYKLYKFGFETMCKYVLKQYAHCDILTNTYYSRECADSCSDAHRREKSGIFSELGAAPSTVGCGDCLSGFAENEHGICESSE